MIFFTAYTHFNHANIIKYCSRPFSTVEEMNAVLTDNWNSVVRTKDTVYHLGDFGFGDIEGILRKINGKIVLIEGSHDEAALKCKDQFKEVARVMEISYQKQQIVLCHYCMRVWPRSHYNSWHLFGHSHGRLEPVGKSWDVGVDNNGFKPLSFKQVKTIMDERPDNFNLVKREDIEITE